MATPSELHSWQIPFYWSGPVSQTASVKPHLGQELLPENWPQENPDEDLVKTILINPTDVQEPITHIFLLISYGTEDVLLNTNCMLKLNVFKPPQLSIFM